MAHDVSLAGHWPAGTKVGAFARTGDSFVGGRPVKTATVGGDGLVFKALEEGRYFAAPVDEDSPGPNAVSFTAKAVPAARARTPAPTSADFSTHPRVLSPTIITGPKGTKVCAQDADGHGMTERFIERPVDRGHEPHPHLNQASISDKVPQRSNTPLGEATPVDPGEPQPKPTQDRVNKGARQRSETVKGEATVVTEDSGPKRQQDAAKDLKQRSRTETGEQTPIGSAEPRGTSSNPDSREQAAGERPTDSKPQGKTASRPDAARKVNK